MTINAQDSSLLSGLFADPEIARLFSDSATVRAMMIVHGTLAKVQGEAGMIPETAGAFLHRAALEIQLDPGGLAAETAQNGVCVPALVAAFRKALEAPEHAQFLHWGATSQDIIDTGQALRLRQALTLIAARLDAVLDQLAKLAEDHAETAMMARTYGQPATITTFGAQVAIWGEGLLAVRGDLDRVRDGVCIVTLNGASGTLSAMGEDGPAIRRALGAALGLRDPENSPHAERSAIRDLAAWCHRTLQACDKIAADLMLWTRDGALRLGTGGSSSTMPQKQNPVGPSVIRALTAHGGGMATALQAPAHAEARDGGAWFTEWLTLSPLVAGTAKALDILQGLSITPDAARLLEEADDPSGLVHAEALTFHLARSMPRPDAQAQVKTWAAEIRANGGSLLEQAGVDPVTFAPSTQWGEAPLLARRFAAKVRDNG